MSLAVHNLSKQVVIHLSNLNAELFARQISFATSINSRDAEEILRTKDEGSAECMQNAHLGDGSVTSFGGIFLGYPRSSVDVNVVSSDGLAGSGRSENRIPRSVETWFREIDLCSSQTCRRRRCRTNYRSRRCRRRLIHGS